MTTQAVTATIGNGRMSKVFGGTVTDGVWTNIRDTLSDTNLGILIPRAPVNFIQAEYAGGLMAYRIQNAQSLAVSRRGWGALEDYSCFKSSMIPTYAIGSDDMIQVYSQPVAQTDECNALAWVHTTKGVELYEALGIADNTATEMKTALQDQSFGDAAFNSTLTQISICLNDGANLDKVEFIDSAGGVVLTIQGDARIPSPVTNGGISAYYNLMVPNMGLQVTKGFTMKITVTPN